MLLGDKQSGLIKVAGTDRARGNRLRGLLRLQAISATAWCHI